MADQILTQDYLKSIFTYEDGNLYWTNHKYKSYNGKKAGTLGNEKYYRTWVNGSLIRTHKLIFLIHHGYLPVEIDHINGIKTDNRIENLRPATKAQNRQNVGMRKDNTSGVKGVSWHKKAQKWYVQLSVNAKIKNLGLYDDLELAILVAEEARDKYHGEYARHK